MSIHVDRPEPAQPVEDLGGGITRDDRGVERYMGWSTEEALNAAVTVGTLYAWEWLQAWTNAELDEDDEGPDGEDP